MFRCQYSNPSFESEGGLVRHLDSSTDRGVSACHRRKKAEADPFRGSRPVIVDGGPSTLQAAAPQTAE